MLDTNLTPNKENIRKWAEALESGEYTQGRGSLEINTIDGTKHCCLGVACRVAIANGVELAVSVGIAAASFDEDSVALPVRVQKWLGLPNDPIVMRRFDDNVTAISANDFHKASFQAIATGLRELYLNDN